jgi:hypothetical protein
VSGRLLRHLGGQPDEGPLLDVLLNLTPACYQCLANFDVAWPARAAQSPSLLGLGGLPDSCYMWRAGGALDRLRDPARTPD